MPLPESRGADDLDQQPAANLTQEECTERCEAVGKCEGAVHAIGGGARKGDCWMRENINLSKCAKVSFQTLLLKPTKVAAAAAAVPSVALHAAVWAPGGPPELPGYEQLSAGCRRMKSHT